ncbi:MAG: hypothetical protein JXB88_00715 [Spirochaetales bacterium]|nr:hypothetical protein [Spirochaetales bacterium]
MSSLFRVRVLNVAECSAELRLFIIHPDQEKFYTSHTFALGILYDSLYSENKNIKKESALAKAVSMSDILDEEFMKQKSNKYIKNVNIKDENNYPVNINFDEMNDEEFDNYWDNEEGLPQATLVVTVTDPKCICNLEPGMEWETSAYDI